MMAKKFMRVFAFVFLVFMMPLASASFEITKEPVASTIVKEFNSPAIFNLTIKSKQTDNFFIDNILGIILQPSGSFLVNGGEEKSVLLKAFFTEEIKEQYSGALEFAYYVKGQNTGYVDDTLSIKIVPLKNAIDVIVPEVMSMKDEAVTITVDNKESLMINLAIKIESDLFEKEAPVSLKPYENKNITIELDKERLWKEAGIYPVKISVISESEDYVLDLNKNIELAENVDVSVEKSEVNLLFYKKIVVTKTNTGNVPQTVTVELEKTPLEKAFTSFSFEPTGMAVKENDVTSYKWVKELEIGEKLEVISTTNFMVPLMLLIVMAGGALMYFSNKGRAIVIKKKAIRARSKTGEFVSKIVLIIKNRGDVAENIEITDRLPSLTNIHPRFGVTKPENIEKDSLTWRIARLDKNESAIFSYVIYSDVKVLGRRTVPRAAATYTTNGIPKNSLSNEVFLMS